MEDHSWPEFIRQLMEMVRKERPDLVDHDTLVISNTTKIDGYNWLLHKYQVVGKPLGFELPIDKAKIYLSKAVQHGFITFREITTKDKDGNTIIVYGVHLND